MVLGLRPFDYRVFRNYDSGGSALHGHLSDHVHAAHELHLRAAGVHDGPSVARARSGFEGPRNGGERMRSVRVQNGRID